jgi:hypothetical protein
LKEAVIIQKKQHNFYFDVEVCADCAKQFN